MSRPGSPLCERCGRQPAKRRVRIGSSAESLHLCTDCLAETSLPEAEALLKAIGHLPCHFCGAKDVRPDAMPKPPGQPLRMICPECEKESRRFAAPHLPALGMTPGEPPLESQLEDLRRLLRDLTEHMQRWISQKNN